MNPHYHPYSDLGSSPHSPSPDNNNYPQLTPHHNGHGGGPGGAGNPMGVSQMDSHAGFHGMNNGGGPVKHCAGCGVKITERFFLHALDRYWHNSCLKCSCCGAMLADIGSSCYTRSGMILCKTDYSRLFGSGACSACHQSIPANEFVMRTTSHTTVNNNVNAANNQNGTANNNNNNNNGQTVPQHHVFHLKCFQCSKCGCHLVQGDRYYMLGGSLVCEQDWHKLVKTSNAQTNPPLRKGKVGRPRRSRD
ncbi:LIM domain transcription factor LMO4 [Toxorhynchites rutilus septentrionalis]|uniref:LIM domain transcription factor LMO4 n=1 Tax=Toxorhynchites rutilus septentrionalis TaxID=329112 RepID=UPI00247A8364|nr:LIM domain transcription factor LMO4 [Toxorhynchites rutilus septentrionalis]XP_055635151.1 LIM domain transcription factor LMO4 [Toxorhynchites rutilus septentrionalis]XP_055635152.1 LIM domain transcription factor LMO4 [Toxorhynchites rutilus septentrionalis]XP_055635153.1 LIM domain transcription factor LMO4 [Toxorhynchites rutilus septentrionalis]XP_055635154.1 LIM domain transcription factor LMO4 [Toxorhynchites rutilus septentrionalis]XP_055635155.1 LIM domain transcription factor LMO